MSQKEINLTGPQVYSFLRSYGNAEDRQQGINLVRQYIEYKYTNHVDLESKRAEVINANKFGELMVNLVDKELESVHKNENYIS